MVPTEFIYSVLMYSWCIFGYIVDLKKKKKRDQKKCKILRVIYYVIRGSGATEMELSRSVSISNAIKFQPIFVYTFMFVWFGELTSQKEYIRIHILYPSYTYDTFLYFVYIYLCNFYGKKFYYFLKTFLKNVLLKKICILLRKSVLMIKLLFRNYLFEIRSRMNYVSRNNYVFNISNNIYLKKLLLI